jgi:hypothetical protein
MIANQQINSDNNLTTWTTDINSGDILAFNIDSCYNITRANVMIKAEKS